MMSTVLFQVWPYAALALFVGGLAGRLLLMRGCLPPTPYERASAWASFRGDRIWRRSLGIVIIAHLAGLMVPRAVLAWNAIAWRLYLLEGLGLLVGLVAVGASARLIGRYLKRPAGAPAVEIADSIFLSLLYVASASGVLMAVVHRWASSWAVATLTPYALSILRGQPAAVLVDHLPFLVQLHLISSVAVVAVIPFTRLALFPVAALHRAVVLATGTFSALVRRADTWWRQRDRMAWLWPEGQVRWIDDSSRQGRPSRAAEGSQPRTRQPEMDRRLYESGS